MELLLIVVLMVSSFTHSTANDICKEPTDTFEPWRRPYLPQTIQPVRYDLTLFPDFYYNASFLEGYNIIQFKVIKATNTILVHQKDLKITTTEITATTCSETPNVTKTFQYDNYWVIQTNETMQASNCTLTLHLKYNGKLAMSTWIPFYTVPGFFKTKYINRATKKESWLVGTHLEPFHSRLVFPNFDEPRFKAPFLVVLKHWKNFTALSNMEIESIDTSDDSIWAVSHFKLSPPMSSYLATFIISEFAFKANNLTSGQRNRVWVRPEALKYVDYALKVSVLAENYLHREFDIAYPLKKLDHFALPEFGPNGMENWGLISYKDSHILIDEKKEGFAAKLHVLYLISHELAHNYFGNLVTCRFWNHLWLNEGFATFYGTKAATEVDPTLYNEVRNIVEDLEFTMANEANNITNALVPVLSPRDDARSLFDSIRYTKGAAILRMVESFMGPANFKSGVRRYLRDNLYKTAETSHFWAALQQYVNDSNLNLEEVMKTWVYQPGFPIVLILPHSDDQVIATQERFFSNRHAVQDCRYTWHIPLNYRTNRGSDGLFWLKETYAIVNVSLNAPGDWIQFNHDSTGYYIVNYDNTLWERIVNQLKEDYTAFSESARLQLFGDVSRLVKDGHVGYDRFFSLTKYASEERGFGPWTYMIAIIDRIKPKISNTARFNLFQRHILNLTSSFVDELGIQDEGTDVNKFLRPQIIPLSCPAGHRGCIKNMTKMFKEWIKNTTTNVIPVQYKTLVYCIGVANSVLESEWNTVYERSVAESTDYDERDDLVKALTCSRNVTLLKRLLQYAINETNTPHWNRWSAFNGIASNPASKDCVFEWLQLNYTEADIEVRERLSDTMISAVVENVVTRERRDKVLGFLNQYQFTDRYSIAWHLENMEKKIDWMDKNFPSIDSWFEDNVVNY